MYDGLRPTGVDRVGLAYVQRYGANARAILSERGFCSILSETNSQQAFELLTSSTADRSAIRNLVTRACVSSIVRRRHNCNGVLLHTSHSGMEYPRYYGTLKRNGIRPVFLIHDLIPLTHAEYCRPGVELLHRKRINTVLQYADGLIANSQATLASIHADAATTRIASVPSTVVARLAPGITLSRRMPSPLSTPYFVMLGTIEPRKNHWLLLHVWRRLVEQQGTSAPKLVVIGRRGWECENVIDMLERCSSIRDSVIEESDCSDDRLHAWLQHARALLFPSFVEGYGMPLVEALLLRVPVLASDLPVFHEIAGDIPDYLDPLDGPGWLARIQAYAHASSPARADQLERIEHFRAPTWADHFEQVDHFLDSLS
jgi:glycosyltransferase involved in cell wall biosynthesis